MIAEPSRAQDATFHNLAEIYPSIFVRPCPPGDLWLARCLDANGDLVEALYVYGDGSTRHRVRSQAA